MFGAVCQCFRLKGTFSLMRYWNNLIVSVFVSEETWPEGSEGGTLEKIFAVQPNEFGWLQ